MPDRIVVQVDGLAEFRRNVRAAGPEARRAFTDELKKVVVFGRDLAVYQAHAQGLDDTGDLIAGLKGGLRGTTGYVRDTAMHRGYPYPARIEFEQGGKHSFLRKAIAQGRPEIERRLVAAVNNVVHHIETGA